MSASGQPTATSGTAASDPGAPSASVPSPKSTDATHAPGGVVAEPTDEAVLNYLRKRGMGYAVLELSRIVRERHHKQTPLSSRSQLELDDTVARNKRTLLSRTTGGGFGYDADGAPSIAQWGVPDTLADGKSGDPPLALSETSSLSERLGRDEARAYVDSFTALQTWVLSLPDDPAAVDKNPKSLDDKSDDVQNETDMSIASVIRNAAAGSDVPDDVMASAKSLGKDSLAQWMPPSAKPELLAVSFALFVHTYCELLEVGMEPTAKSLFDAFQPVYEPLYQRELADLAKCRTTEEMVRLNSHNTVHLDSLATLKAITLQVANLRAKKKELNQDTPNSNAQLVAAKQRKVAECDQHIVLLKQKYDEVTKRASAAAEKTQDLPFLRRARAIRWQLTLSATSYGMLAAFLSSRELLLPISTLLQTKCEINVERRDPLPFTPPCILDDMVPDKGSTVEEVRWAAPVPPASRLTKAGEEVDSPSVVKQPFRLPFPRYHLEEEYDSQRDADASKRNVEFNRALLVNGFRRLEALERKQEYEVGLHRPVDGETKDQTPLAGNPLEPSVLLSTLCSSTSPGPVMANTSSRPGTMDASAIWEESGVGITCAKMCPPDGRRVAAGCDDAAVRIWSLFDPASTNDSKEKAVTDSSRSGVSETAMVLLGHKNGFPVFDVDWNRDGRTLLSAGGDGSVRLWDTMAMGPYGRETKISPKRATPANSKTSPDINAEGMAVPGTRPESNAEVSGAALAVYRGHAPSSPIWSVSFAPSGYYFASAGSDGTARLWTTDRPSPVRILSGHTSPSVNCVKWHPNCNYVLTGSDDKTVRMWDVQSGQCVRLMSGCSRGVSIVAVCPSGRYVSGADSSGIISIWDLGSGRKINELKSPREPRVGSKRDSSGVARVGSSLCMIHALSYSACGTSLATGGDDCTVRIWDVRGAANHMSNPDYASKQGWGEATSVSHSRAQLNRHPSGDKNRPGMKEPVKSFRAQRTLIMDLKYTKRNLLLSVGKYAAPLPVPITD